MSNDLPNTTTESSSVPITAEESKEAFQGHGLSKIDHDLYKEEDDIALPIIRVKRISLPNKGERWKIFSDTKVVFIIEGSKLNNKDKQFLRSLDGVNFLISRFKSGIKSFNSLKKEIKKRHK